MVHTTGDIFSDYIFLGLYKERRYLSELNDYRDLVIISPAETELLKNLIKFRHNLKNEGVFKWIGISGPGTEEDSSEHSLWVKLKNVPFGHFWFQIKKISYQDKEISFKLKCIRELKMEDYTDACLKTNKKSDEEISGESEGTPIQLYLYQMGESFYSNLKNLTRQIESQLTLRNFILVTKFISSALFVLIVVGSEALKNFGFFTLRFLEVIAHLIEVMTPLLLHLMDCCTKIIGGLYIFLYKIFEGRRLKRLETPPKMLRYFPETVPPPKTLRYVPETVPYRNYIVLRDN